MRFLWKLKVAVGLLILTSCSASWHLKRAIAKEPTIVRMQPVRLDTTIVTEIKVAKGSFFIEADTALAFEEKGVRTEIRVVSDTFYVETTCPPDTITVSKEIYVPKVVYTEKFSNFDLVKLILVIIIILSLYSSFRRIK